jgi:hypothetical protein
MPILAVLQLYHRLFHFIILIHKVQIALSIEVNYRKGVNSHCSSRSTNM